MKKTTNLLKLGIAFAIGISTINLIPVQADENVESKEDSIGWGEYANENGFYDIESHDMNPRLRGMESPSYARKGNYLIYAKGEKSLYSNHSMYSKVLAYVKEGEVMVGTERYGDFVYATSTKGKGWIYVANTSAKLVEPETINTTFKTSVTTTVYKQPFIDSRFKTAKKLPAGTYKATKRANYFVYVTSGSVSGWISTQYNDSGNNIGKVGGTFPSTKGYLSTTTIGTTKLITKTMNEITDGGRPGIPMIPKYVTIHNTANISKGAGAESHANLQYRGESNNASWHFQVDNNVIYQSIPMNEVAWHAGDGNTMGNASTIAIEICENSDGNYAVAERNAARLTARLLFENNLPSSAVKLHKDWSGKNCARNIIQQTKGSLGWANFKTMVVSEYDKLASSFSLNVSSKTLYTSQEYQLSATFTSSSTANKTLTWSSSAPSVASVSTTGKVTSLKAGTAVISAKNKYGKTVKATITVKNPFIRFNATSMTAYKGYNSSPSYTTGPATGKVELSSSDPSVIAISGTSIKGIKEGTTQIKARWNNLTTTMNVTVKNPSVKLSKTSATIYTDYTTTLKATAYPSTKVTWTSSNPSIASISSSGTVSGKRSGTAYIYASINGAKVSCKVVVKTSSLKISTTKANAYTGIFGYTLKASATPNVSVKWKSSNTSIASVSSTGFVTGKKAGTVTITAYINGVSKSCRMTFKNPYRTVRKVNLNVTQLNFNKVRGYQLRASYNPSNATIRKVKWTSSNASVATVSSSGYVRAKKKGTTYISATAHNGVRKTIKVVVYR